ncbi:beta-Ala-His dipeptidase, partial [Oceanispirochaeta sp.]|uniref:beta-Ala-His dipeptidase n=1 Tax=Oceanispirochaeta sp. TaxID=2035350 RepID=UPI00261827D5
MNHTDQILSYLVEINKTPRKSENSGPITDWLQTWGEDQGYKIKRDRMNNLVIKVPGTKGYEKSAIVVLQGHSDMVCEKLPDSKHDFSKDPVIMVREGDWVRGDKTTLGADNGIALALAMDLVTSEDVSHPPLEILITSDEEIGLVGANHLEKGFVEGKILINMDSEDEGIFTIGCAGGADSRFNIPLTSEKAASEVLSYSLTVGGLKGGHSGMDIHLNLGNALKMAERVLSQLSLEDSFRLAGLEGGSGASNAICRDGVARFVLSDTVDVQKIVSAWEQDFINESGTVEKDLFIKLEEVSKISQVLTQESGLKILRVIRLIPHGVGKVSSDIENLVETSSNLAWASVNLKGADFLTSQRSAVMSELKDMNERMVSLALLAGGSCDTLNKYPSWKPNPSSALLEKSVVVYKRACGKDPVIEAIHAGLECGLIGDKYPGMDMISIGPTIKHP